MTAKLPPLGDRPRGSRVWRCSLRVADPDRHSATGLMARYKGQHGFEIPLAFCAAKIPSRFETSQPARAAYAPTNYESEFPPAYQRRKIFQPHLSIPTCKGCVCPTPTAGEQSGDRQRREKGPPILTAEKGEHRSAHERWCSLSNSDARDVASPAVKMGNRSLFPGVAVPLAFFCTLFFRHRKKSVSAP